MKLTVLLHDTYLSNLTPMSMESGTILFSKTPGLDLEDIGSLNGLFHSKVDENHSIAS